MRKLAIFSGPAVSDKLIPIAKPVFVEKEIKDVIEVLRSGNVRQGRKTEEFERRFCEKVGCNYAYAVNSGTAALHTAFLSILKPGDEVIVPAFTFISTASTVVFSNARPVFADIDEETFTIDHEDVKEKISSRTKAIVPVHLFGHAADMKALQQIAEDHDLYVVSDAAQAHGTKVDGKDVGSFDDLNCYSFYATKIITTGEGGMVTTNNEELYEKGKLIRSHGQKSKYYHTLLGLNYRMMDITAVLGLNQLDRLDSFVEKRRHNAMRLTEGIKNIEGIRPPVVKSNVYHSFYQYSVLMDLSKYKCTRDEFIEAMKAENIECVVHYPVPLTKQPAFEGIVKINGCPVAEDVSKRIFSIPVHPQLSNSDIEKILIALEKVSSFYLKK
ncbi:MAG: DegT/DnrJ/EryC1/StrS family aminotransferase [Candidatus Bathyarchaeaceae archaeon]